MNWVKNVCRLCGQVEEILYNIFDSDNNLEEKIKRYLNLEIVKEDFKPKQMCRTCYIKLNDLSNFIDVCYATNMKFESIYYMEPWNQNNEKKTYELLNHHKQSVIVSNRQGVENCSQFYRHSDSAGIIGVLPHYTLDQPDNILDFSINYNNIQPVDIQNCFNECGSFDKSENISVTKQKECMERDETLNNCLINKSGPNDLLDPVENEPNPKVSSTVVSPRSSKSVLISVNDVRKSVQTIKHNKEQSEIKTRNLYSCPYCEKIFKRRSNLNAHISFHTKIRPYKCSNCPKTFAIKCHLTQHKKTHSDIFVCQVCCKKFEVPSKLSRHMQTHSKNKPFVCSVPGCKKGFSDKNNLKQHTLIHSPENNFCCAICMKQFKTRKNLKAHINSHVNDNKFQCKFCQKVFKYKHNLKTHLIKHKNDAEDNKT